MDEPEQDVPQVEENVANNVDGLDDLLADVEMAGQ